MSRKVFISVLGTGFYGECSYSWKGIESKKTRFIQEAMIEHLNISEWRENDAAYILLTDHAKSSNWDISSGKRCNPKTDQDEVYQGLKKRLGNMLRLNEEDKSKKESAESAQLPRIVEGVSIPDGKDENEMWGIFQIVYDLLQEGDELYIDLTHSFRYIPMLLLVLSNYAKFLKDIKIVSITYGNYEARDKTSEIAPIIDLLPLATLQDWTFAAADFVENGNTKGLKGLSDENLHGLLQSGNINAQQINALVRKLDQFVNSLKLCRGMDIINGRKYREIVECRYEQNTMFEPLKPILENILTSLSRFSTTHDPLNAIAAAKWCYDKGQYQAAVTELQEGIVTFYCNKHGIPVNDEGKREIINHAFLKAQKTIENKIEDYIPFESQEYEDKVNEVFNANIEFRNRTFLNNFASLSKVRNDLNHSGMRGLRHGNGTDRPRTPENLIRFIGDSLDFFFGWLKEATLPPLLINLSNHPYATWSVEQKEAAKKYGECEDMAFPQVDPKAEDTEIDDMPKKILSEIAEKAKDHSLSVHVMGEMCLTFSIVQKLQAAGIHCIASTTERIVKENPDGSKTSEFHFVRFREY